MATIINKNGEVLHTRTIKGNLVSDPVVKMRNIPGFQYPVKVVNVKILENVVDENGNRIEGAKPNAYWVEAWRNDATNMELTMKKGDFIAATGVIAESKFIGTDNAEHTTMRIKNASCALLKKKAQAVSEPARQAIAEPAQVA